MGLATCRFGKTHTSTVPSLTAPATTFRIDDAGATATTTFIFHDILQIIQVK